MITAAMLTVIQDAGEGVLVLTDSLEEHEFTRSRLTRSEVRRQLRLMADTLEGLPRDAQASMPEIDWAGWRTMALVLAPATAGLAQDEAAWFAARSLVPATLSWLRVYQRSEPALFRYSPVSAQ
ncbi:MAG: hypothetical protein HY855_01680 [Burkholderiales bacterium]|nr:hypothetical protein [Burkholderiales bacterium]